MFWTRFVELCNRKGVSPTKVATALGFSSSIVVKWKRGSKVRYQTLSKIAEYFGVPVSYFDEDVPEGNLSPDPGNTYYIPIFESVSAGFGAYASSAVVGHRPMFAKNEAEAKELICIRVKGDSMYPTIEDGDTVTVRKTDTVDNGTIGVVLCEDEGYIKKIEYDDKKVVLRSINPMYPPITFEGSDILRLRVVGEVIEVNKRIKK